jgi:hypothetical protein
VSQEEAAALAEEAIDEFLTAEELYNYLEYQAEQYAESAWLRAAENASWEEAWLDDMRESGLIV